HLSILPETITHFSHIPCLPVSFFKTHTVKTGDWEEQVVYTSSGTTGQVRSRHAVFDEAFYLRNAERAFQLFFGAPDQYHILALLPSYLERDQSSLIAMVDSLIRNSGSPSSGFFLHEHQKLVAELDQLRHSDRTALLLGVSFALLDVAEN